MEYREKGRPEWNWPILLTGDTLGSWPEPGLRASPGWLPTLL